MFHKRTCLTPELTGEQLTLMIKDSLIASPVEWVVRFRASSAILRCLSLHAWLYHPTDPPPPGDSSPQRINSRCLRGLRSFKSHLHSTAAAEPLKIQDDWFETLIFVIQQKPNARINPTAEVLYQAFKLSNERHAIRGRVQWDVRPPARFTIQSGLSVSY